MWCLHLGAVAVNHIMPFREIFMQVIYTIVRFQKHNKSIRKTPKTLGVGKSPIWYILRKKKHAMVSSATKNIGRPDKTKVVDDGIIVSIIKKKFFTMSRQVKN